MEDRKETIRGQKHQFILQYYNMAVKDLERHLKIGWETMTTIAGALVLLSTGYQNYLPIPLAVTGAIAILFWGISNLIDADHWATRAIAFLANVESIYFTKNDRKNFNPYIGYHPPLKMMDSLKSQLNAAVFLLLIAIAFYWWIINQRIDGYEELKTKILGNETYTLIFWNFPILTFFSLLYHVIRARYKRFVDYLYFVTNSPGPGLIISNENTYRDVDLSGSYEPSHIEPAEEIQKSRISSLQNKVNTWNKFKLGSFILGICVYVIVLGVIFFKSWLFPESTIC